VDDLEAERARRWWHYSRAVHSLRRAASFVGDVDFALLFPARRLALPSLWQATVDRPVDEEPAEWAPDVERVWRWKDELPLHGLAWSGRFLRRRPSLLSPALLDELYPRGGEPDDFLDEPAVGDDARRVAATLLSAGPLPSSALRRTLGMDGRAGQARFDRAVAELGRGLVVTGYGSEEPAAGGRGWPGAVLELTARAFPLEPEPDRAAARVRAARRFLATMIAARPLDLATTLGWPAGEARDAIEALVDLGHAAEDGAGYRLLDP
jgi:hypothetical protein